MNLAYDADILMEIFFYHLMNKNQNKSTKVEKKARKKPELNL